MLKAEQYFARFDQFRGTWVVTYANADSGVRGEGRKWEMLKDGLKAKVIVFATAPKPFDLPEDADKFPKAALRRLRERHEAKFAQKEFITIPGERNLHVYSPTTLLDELHPTGETANSIIGNTPFALCYGYLEFVPILDVLKSMDLSTRVEELDGHEACVLRGEARDGSQDIELWFDRNLDYVIRQIECRKKISVPGVADRYVKLIHKQNDFREMGGVLIPMSAEGTVVSPPMPMSSMEDGKLVSRKDASGNVVMRPANTVIVSQELQSFDYRPAFVAADFEPTVPIEAGARVHMQDAKQLQYEWKDGEAEPVVPDIPTGHEFAQDGNLTGRFLMVLGAVALAFFVAVVVYRQRKRT